MTNSYPYDNCRKLRELNDIRIPKSIAKEVGFIAGDLLRIEIDGNKLILTKVE